MAYEQTTGPDRASADQEWTREYIADMAAELARMARGQGDGSLAELLAQAARQARTGPDA